MSPNASVPSEAKRSGVDAGTATLTDEPDITDAELAEFLACDLDPVQADPAFREQLREELWALVRDGHLGRRQDH